MNVTDCKVNGTAAQKGELFSLFPQLFEFDTNNTDSDLWLSIMKLMELNYCDSIEPKYRDEYYCAYKNFGREIRRHPKLIKCKSHYLAHVAEVMEIFGPTTRFDNMSQERNHQISTKKMARQLNFVNPTQTLMLNYQSYQLVNNWPKCIVRKKIFFNEKQCNFESMNKNHIKILECCATDTISSCKKVMIEGIPLAEEGFYALKQTDRVANYFRIIKIYNINGIPQILGYEFNNCRFIGEYYSYSLNMSVRKQLRILDRKQLVSGRTFCAYNCKNMSLIIKSRKISNKFKIFQLYED